MRFRVALAGVLLGASSLLGSLRVAGATETWDDVDPPVVIQTPAGNLQVVYVVTSGPLLHLAELLAPSITYEVKPTGDGRTRVDMYVTVADVDGHGHEVASEVWTGPGRTGTRLSAAEGNAGSPMRHKFQLNVP